ncbi:cysteine hydrolase family protein [Desulfonatronovibrio hydrogenovorans]|uniref:cysteine hydrolase family protein n=1 Tax=Desulfonatronovibrio hydrogenovorans TaxID=53245 RepID=UPI00048CAB64|nr:isochorismatase family cysteine hydrolase [Desulfonatronovibrio hydrogenovorans]
MKNTALLLIDMQNEASFNIKEMDQALDNAALVLSSCRKAGIPVLYSRHTHRPDGLDASLDEPIPEKGNIAYCQGTSAVEIDDRVRPRPGEPVIDKHRWSSFFATELDLLLRAMDIRNLVVGGFVTDGCVLNTVYDAFFRDYRITLVKDMMAASSLTAHACSIINMANWVYGITILKADETVKMVSGRDYRAWHWKEPDQFHPEPEEIMEVYASLE